MRIILPQRQAGNAHMVHGVESAALTRLDELEAAPVIGKRLLVVPTDFGEGGHVEYEPFEAANHLRIFGQLDRVLGACASLIEVPLDKGQRAEQLLRFDDGERVANRRRQPVDLVPVGKRLRHLSGQVRAARHNPARHRSVDCR